MKINRIKITGLFDLFNYNIPINENGDMRIITGPNGFGKTMILNIIYNLFNKRFFFFQKLVFSNIEIEFDSEYRIVIVKSKEKIKKTDNDILVNDLNDKNKERSNVHFIFFKSDKDFYDYEYTIKNEDDLSREIERFISIQRVSEEQWLDKRTDSVLSLDDLLHKYRDMLPERVLKNISNRKLKNEEANSLLNSLTVHLIKEQRLLKQTNLPKRNFERNDTVMTNTIQEYAEDLSQLIKNTVDESFQITRELDSTFPKRLLEEKEILSADEFNERFEKLKGKQERLKKFGLSASQQEVPIYDTQNAKVLLVYLNDSEEKTKVFDALLNRIELFTDILNKRRFTFKNIQIERDKGFVFYTNTGKELNLTDLSSGEQHEVVLLYELIFKAKANTMVLIDEPEISLHVTWQTEFLNDLFQIVKLQNILVLIATHSPQIINDNWHLTVDLARQVRK